MDTQAALDAVRHQLGILLDAEEYDPVALSAAKKEAERLTSLLREEQAAQAAQAMARRHAAPVPPVPPALPPPAPTYAAQPTALDMERMAQAVQSATVLGIKHLTVELRGTWVWLSGDTKPHAEALGRIGFRHDGKKTSARADGLGVWYLAPPGGRKGRKGRPMTDDFIRSKYGVKTLYEED